MDTRQTTLSISAFQAPTFTIIIISNTRLVIIVTAPAVYLPLTVHGLVLFSLVLVLHCLYCSALLAERKSIPKHLLHISSNEFRVLSCKQHRLPSKLSICLYKHLSDTFFKCLKLQYLKNLSIWSFAKSTYFLKLTEVARCLSLEKTIFQSKQENNTQYTAFLKYLLKWLTFVIIYTNNTHIILHLRIDPVTNSYHTDLEYFNTLMS